jgi:hypothetical protein
MASSSLSGKYGISDQLIGTQIKKEKEYSIIDLKNKLYRRILVFSEQSSL